MPTAEELQADKDFVTASPSDQSAYLSSIDDGFKSASSSDKTRYLAYVSGKAGTAAIPKPPKPNMQFEGNVTDSSAESLVKGFGKNIYQISAPGILTSVLEKTAPSIATHLPAAMRSNASPAAQLPGQIVMNAAPMMVGEEAPIPERGAIPVEPRPTPKPAVQGTGIMGRIARHLPVIGKPLQAFDLMQEILGKGEAPSVPEEPGVPANWGKGVHGTPIGEWGNRIPESTEAKPQIAPRYRDATHLNEEFAGDEAPKSRAIPTAKEASGTPIYRDATLSKRNIPEYAGEEAPPSPVVSKPTAAIPTEAPAQAAGPQRAIRVLPKEEPNFSERPRQMSGESALNHYGTWLPKADLVKLAEKRGIPTTEIEDLLAKGKTVTGTGEGGHLTGEDIANNVKTEVTTSKLWSRIQETYSGDELDQIADRANTFKQAQMGGVEGKRLGKGAPKMVESVKKRFFPELLSN